jgi:hypothetical protein
VHILFFPFPWFYTCHDALLKCVYYNHIGYCFAMLFTLNMPQNWKRIFQM